MTHANCRNLIRKSLPPSGVQYEVGNSTQLYQTSPKNGPLPDASSMKCDGFRASTCSKLCHVTWRTTILLRWLGERQSPWRRLFRCRRTFVRNDVVANGVSVTSGVRRSWKADIYRLHRADLYSTKECSGSKAAQFCGISFP